MKAPSQDQVAAILVRKKINEKVDLAVATGKKHGQPRFDVALLDTVFRPFCHELEYEHSHGSDSDEVLDATCAAVANMMVEFIRHVVEKGDKAQTREAFNMADIMIGKVAEYLSRGVMVNYGQDTLTPQPPSGRVPSRSAADRADDESKN